MRRIVYAAECRSTSKGVVKQSVLSVETATVFRGGGRRYFTKKAALKSYANRRYRLKHPCECEQPDYGSGYPGYSCMACLAREKVMVRYLRMLKKAELRKRG